MIFKIFLLILYILVIISIIFIERKNPSQAISWILIVTAIPYIGLLLYFIFGNTVNIKITRYIRAHRLSRRQHILNDYYRALTPEGDLRLQASLSEVDRKVAAFNRSYNRSPLTTFDSAHFFTSGQSHYEALFRDIQQAQKNIHVEFFTIHDDPVGRAFVSALAEKAAQGVTVTVICDFFANIGRGRRFFAPIVNAGGYCRRVKRTLTHFRSHRKIVTIDGKIAYIGGMNIGKQYANGDKVKTPWRDTQIRLTGACVGVLEDYVNLDTICSMPKAEFKTWEEHCKIHALPSPSNIPNACQFIMGGVDTDLECMKMCYLSMIRNASQSIRIQSPYFVPDISILDELRAACASGIRVEIMLPRIKSNFFLQPVSDYYANELAAYGAKIYKYNGYIHAKTMIIDEELCCVGSVNMDIRSLEVDDEICGIFYNNDLVAEYQRIYNQDIESSVPFDPASFNGRSRACKIREKIFLLFAPLM